MEPRCVEVCVRLRVVAEADPVALLDKETVQDAEADGRLHVAESVAVALRLSEGLGVGVGLPGLGVGRPLVVVEGVHDGEAD